MMKPPLERQLQAYARHLVAEAERPPELDGTSNHSRSANSFGRVAYALCAVVLAGGLGAALVSTGGDDTPVAEVPAIEPADGSNSADNQTSQVTDAEVATAIGAAPAELPTSLAPLGEPQRGTIATSEGEVELVVSRVVGELRDGDGFCANGVCYGSGFATDLERMHLMGGETLPDGDRLLIIWTPWRVTEVSVAWDDGSESTASTTQPHGAHSPRLTAVRVPAAVLGGVASDGRDEVRIDLPAVVPGPSLTGETR